MYFTSCISHHSGIKFRRNKEILFPLIMILILENITDNRVLLCHNYCGLYCRCLQTLVILNFFKSIEALHACLWVQKYFPTYLHHSGFMKLSDLDNVVNVFWSGWNKAVFLSFSKVLTYVCFQIIQFITLWAVIGQ